MNKNYFSSIKVTCKVCDMISQRTMSTAGNSLENFVKNGTKCIGVAANYKSLLKVLNKPHPKIPDFFIKPLSSYITEGEKIILPKDFIVNEEIELGIVIGQRCKNVTESKAMEYVGGYCIALDMTAISTLTPARQTGGSWTLSKAFDTACPVSKFIPKTDIADPHNVQLWCKVNGKEIQNGNTSDLLFNIPYLVSYISQYITLEPNDVIITGSPPGMGPVKKGDVIEGGIVGGVHIKFEVDEAA
ncbi:acylpyruvase FAHD1, mitochondrial-like [Anthonomus grandis grandis]|uniref:acylpyruvase FAHD1, mitochondrial-like n=1 Tax=Anthonomus grandis grandis TaxID=2921223 RepID=UPI002165FB7B|nr:acylpyruvase FAHD1, mitochondrial-like [Anthonomus grandis grandis]